MQWEKMLIVDIECTCYRDGDDDKPEGWASEKDQEITEIGAVMVHLPSREIIDVKSFLARPDGPLGRFAEELTTFTTDKLKDEPKLYDSILDMRKWCKEKKFDIGSMPWGSWGDYDRVQFYREVARKGLSYPFGRAHYNIKGLFSIMTGRKKGFSVEKAMKAIGREFEGRPHRGVDDAKNIAEIYLHLLRKCK